MTWETFLTWLVPVLIVGLFTLAYRQYEKLSAKIDENNKTTDDIYKLLHTELRAMDVRIARIEAHIWPERPRQ